MQSIFKVFKNIKSLLHMEKEKKLIKLGVAGYNFIINKISIIILKNWAKMLAFIRTIVRKIHRVYIRNLNL